MRVHRGSPAGILPANAQKGQQLRLVRPISLDHPRPTAYPTPPAAPLADPPTPVDRRPTTAVGQPIFSKEGQVVAHGGMKKLYLLRHHADVTAQCPQRRISRISTPSRPNLIVPIVGSTRRDGSHVNIIFPLPVPAEESKRFARRPCKGDIT